MAAIKIYKKGNYIIIEDSVSGNYIDAHSNDVMVTKGVLADTDYQIYVGGVKLYTDQALAEIQDEAGVAYVDQATWETFYQANTGGLESLLATPTTIVDGEKDVAVTGTAVALAATKTIKYVTFTAKSGNGATIWYGSSSVTDNGDTGNPLAVSESVTVYIDDISKLYINGTATDGVTFSYYV